MASEGNGKGLQIFLSILSIAGLGVAAYTPLYNQIVNVEKRLAHSWLLEKNAGARVRFQEVETRLREAKTIADLKFRELKTISMKKTRGDVKTFTQILHRLREVETALARLDERMNKERQP
ncbi:MAG: hypothetical protein J4F48_03070 [Nitrospinae bacterium]|nr:hypothetical protein [Nitrospinota bacterium]